jgi:transposase-like protein
MHTQTEFGHNLACPARGRLGQGNIAGHSYMEKRYRCKHYRQTSAATKGTPFYRLQRAADVVTLDLILLCHGCPLQAIVAAFGCDERTVAVWLTGADQHCQEVHQYLVKQETVDLQHVQADELWVKMIGPHVKIRYILEYFKTQYEKHWFSHELFSAILRLRGMEVNGTSGYAEAFYCRKLLLELGLSVKMEPTSLCLDQT